MIEPLAGEIVAVKSFEDHKEFVKELELLKELGGQGNAMLPFVQLLSFVENPLIGQLHLVTEFGETSLLQAMQNHGFVAGNVHRTLNVAFDVAVAMGHLHQHEYIYTDLHPGNVVWIATAGRWKLVDAKACIKVGHRNHLKEYCERFGPPELARSLLQVIDLAEYTAKIE